MNFNNSRSGEIMSSLMAQHKAQGKAPLELKAMMLLSFKGWVASSGHFTHQSEVEDFLTHINTLAVTFDPAVFEGENSPYKRMEKVFIADVLDIRAGKEF